MEEPEAGWITNTVSGKRCRHSMWYGSSSILREWPSKVSIGKEVSKSTELCEPRREERVQPSKLQLRSGVTENDKDPRVHQMHDFHHRALIYDTKDGSYNIEGSILQDLVIGHLKLPMPVVTQTMLI